MTLAWKPVPGADSYFVEIQFNDPEQGDWHDWYNATVQNASYTFSFVGDQPGRWRVTALDSTDAHSPSSPSVWWVFDYETKFELETPILVSPANNTIFYHYPRDMTLTWTPVSGADSYLVEIQYHDPRTGLGTIGTTK